MGWVTWEIGTLGEDMIHRLLEACFMVGSILFNGTGEVVSLVALLG